MRKRGLVVYLCLLLAVAPGARAGYEVTWWTADGGGGSSTGAAYRVDGTAGQPDAGISRQQECGLCGGFWARVVEAVQSVVRRSTVLLVR